MGLITASQIGAAITARYPSLNESGFVPSLEASASQDESFVASIEAQALRSYTQPNGTLVYVRATLPHFVGAGQFVGDGDIVQVTEADSKTLLSLGRGVLATEDEVAAAQKGKK